MNTFQILTLVGVGATLLVGIASLIINLNNRLDGQRERARKADDDERYERCIERLIDELSGEGAVHVSSAEYKYAARAVAEKRLAWAGIGRAVILPAPPYSA